MLANSFISETQLDGTVKLRQAAITHFFFAQQTFDITFIHLHAGIDGFVHVHFQQEVNTTGQVQTQLHRVSTQITQPLRRGLSQVEGYDVIVTQRLAHNILGRQLIVLVDQTQQTTFAIGSDRGCFNSNTCISQRLACTVQISLSDL